MSVCMSVCMRVCMLTGISAGMFSLAANGSKLCGFSLHSSCFVITKANSLDCHSQTSAQNPKKRTRKKKKGEKRKHTTNMEYLNFPKKMKKLCTNIGKCSLGAFMKGNLNPKKENQRKQRKTQYRKLKFFPQLQLNY